MNDKGIAYAGNKKLSSITGQEEIFETPIQTITGEDIGNLPGLNVTNAVEGNFSRSIRIEGGSDSTAISEFNGPVVFSEKVTLNSDLETNSIFLQGNATVSRKYTVTTAEPTLAGNPGDVEYFDNPERGGYLGWVYTKNNDWYRFGNISISKTANVYVFDQIGIGTNNPGTSQLLVGSGTTQFSIDENGGVGIGTTANQYKLHVIGGTNIVGTLTATSFTGDGSGLTNLNAAALGWTQISGGIYNTALNNVGIGTSVPRFNLELGPIGTSSTSLHVNGTSTFIGLVTTGNVFVGGALTTRSVYEINNISSGIIRASSIGIGTTNPITPLQIGTASSLGVPTNGDIFAVTSIGRVGVGTTAPRSQLDVEGTLRTKITREAVGIATIASNVVTIDLSIAQNFLLSATDNVNSFTIINSPTEASSFTIKIAQDATGGRTIDIDDFKDSGGSPIPVNWPGGGVVPIITPTASRNDIYTFKTFDGGSNWYGIVVGQNFLN
jgi:ribosomal protein S6E (S10)